MIVEMIRQEIESVFNHPYAKHIALALLIVGSGLTGWYFYQQSIIKKNTQAYQLLSNVIHEFDRASQAQASWEDVIVLSGIGYQRNQQHWSSLYFLVMQAYALEQEGKKQESLLLWDRIIANCPKTDPLWYLYSIKHILLKIEISNEQKNSIEQLHNLAYDSQNPYKDQALYYLGFFEHDAWQVLDNDFGSTNSSWAALRK